VDVNVVVVDVEDSRAVDVNVVVVDVDVKAVVVVPELEPLFLKHKKPLAALLDPMP